MKYIDRIDKEFILNFAKKHYKYLIKDAKVEINKCEDFWKVICEKPYEEKEIIYFSDFSIKCLIGVLGHNEIILEWQSALYKKFGNQYLYDLRDKLKNDELTTYMAKCKSIDRRIEELKKVKSDENVK